MHDRRREPGRGSAAAHGHHGHRGHQRQGSTGGHTVGKTSLTHELDEELEAMEPAQETPEDPQALVDKVKRAATAGHARRALKLMGTVDRPQQAQIAAQLGAEARHNFAKEMPTDIGESRPTRVSSEVLFQQTPDGERSTLELIFESRFRLKVGTHPIAKHGRKLDPIGMRRMWDVLEDLPAGHVANNWAVAKLDRYHDTKDKDPRHAHGLFGYDFDGPGEIDISYTDSIIRDGGTTDHDRPGDPLHGVNRFDEVARHEVGHAVDRELGLPSFNILSKTEEAGQWEGYFEPVGYRRAAEQMVRGSSGPIHRLPAGERGKVIDAMVKSMEHSDTLHFRNAIEALHGHHHLKDDPVYRVMTEGLASHNPWLSTRAIAGRHYHQAYKGTGESGAGAQWCSYSEKAYKNHRVSEYQFRAIQEWFAEAYAAFYSPEPGEAKGSRLKEKLPHTHAWFVAHVDNRKAVKKQAKKAHREDRAPKKP